MKILHVLWYGPTGGVESYTRDLFDALESRGCSNALVVAGVRLPGLERQGRPVHFIPELVDFRAETGPRVVAMIDEILQAEQPDVAFLHTAMNAAAADRVVDRVPSVAFAHSYGAICPSGALLHRRSGAVCQVSGAPNWRCVWNAYAQGCNTRRPGGLLSSLRRTDQTGAWFRRTQGIVCDSEYVASRHAQSGFRRELIHVLPSAIQLPPQPASALPWTAEDRALLFCGRLVDAKGLGVLLDAMPEIPAPWRLRVVGEGHDGARLRRRCDELGLSGRVEFLGSVPREELPELFRQAAVVVVPSVWPEPLGMVGPEAMAWGCAVVASDVGGIREWLVDGVTGLAAPPGDAQALAAQVNRVLADPALAARLGAGARRMAERFGFGDHVDRLLQVFRSAVAQRALGVTAGV